MHHSASAANAAVLLADARCSCCSVQMQHAQHGVCHTACAAHLVCVGLLHRQPDLRGGILHLLAAGHIGWHAGPLRVVQVTHRQAGALISLSSRRQGHSIDR